ncbi:hypothetical protein BDA96_04G346200 [Sorghum bicolor]|uniref:Uncharacterized protein n=1 Tax=Sorghum bicolor TaxID=4558 RepID=A0A921R8U5_SORBI|nr:hypothetical protein BDA96_04G346200 [Sorghum bicolor]
MQCTTRPRPSPCAPGVEAFALSRPRPRPRPTPPASCVRRASEPDRLPVPHPVAGTERRLPASFREATYAAAAREGRRRRPRPRGRACGVEQVARRHRSGPSDTAASSRPVLTCLCGQGWRGRSGATRWPCPGAVTACPILYFSLV